MQLMSKVRLPVKHRVPREWQSLSYLDAQQVLVGLRVIELQYPLGELRYHAASLRTRELREFGEGRQAALFCYGMSQVLGVPVAFARSESQDYDVVVRYAANDQLNYAPVQLKEWVPDFLNPGTTLQDELDKLAKYVDSKDLAVALHLNREATVRIDELTLPYGNIGSLWFYGATEPSQTKWQIIGNLLADNPRRGEFLYPVA